MTDIFQQRYYKINKFYLSLIGLWPHQSRRWRFPVFAFIFSVAVLTALLLTIVIFEFWDDPEIIAESTAPILTTITVVLRMVAMVASADKRFEIFRRIEMDWVSMDQHPAINILRKYAERGRQFTIAFSVGIFFVATLYGSRPIASRILAVTKLTNEALPKALLFPVYLYGLDLDTHYYYILVSEYILTMIFIAVIIAMDTTFIIQVEHACGMFAVVGYVKGRVLSLLKLTMLVLGFIEALLSYQLQCMANEITKEYSNYSHPKLDPAYQNLTVCIAKHRDVIEFSKILNASYTWYFFVTSGIAMMSISYAAIQTVVIMNMNPKEAIIYVVFLITFVVVVLFHCLFAQRLCDHSQQVAEYICQSEWYKTSLATQKLLNLITMRTYVPCQLTAGKFGVLSLKKFTLVIKTSMSYFTVMRSMQ